MKQIQPDGWSRRAFLQTVGLGTLGLEIMRNAPFETPEASSRTSVAAAGTDDAAPATMIGAYGPWMASIVADPPELSYRRDAWTDLDAWRTAARERLLQRLAQPETGEMPPVTVRRQYTYDGLHIEELAWQLPYGPPTEAVLLKPEGVTGPLPGVLALHDHGGDKYFGKRKVVRTGEAQHEMMTAHQQALYDGRAWANELARRGYVVLAPDAFAFGSRRVRLADVPERIRGEATDVTTESSEEIERYNGWAGGHEHIMARSLFCAGTTWPGVVLADDQRALDVLCARPDVDAERVGCGGLSGGGLRTVYLGGVDPRIRCAVCVGMMTTWRDYLLNKSSSHTWMIYPPLLPRELDYPEILGLRVPLPALVQNNRSDPLFTMPEMERADRILQAVYDKAGAAEQYHCSFYSGPHKFDQEMQEEAFAWFDQWL